MRKALVILLGVCFLALFIGSVSARDVNKEGKTPFRDWTEKEFPQLVDPGAHSYMTAQVDTYCIVWYDFEAMDWQGFTQVDNTAQVDTFTHVDDFAGLGGGDYGGLVAIEGTQSMWCGTRPGTSQYLCGWIYPPGYGNSWNQMLVSDPFAFTGLLTFSYHGYFDSEDGWDFTYVEYDAGEGNWQNLATYDGVNDTIAIHELLLPLVQTKLRFHFVADGAWSDEDGLFNTDGAFIVDSLTISDVAGPVDFEDFESPAVPGDKGAGIWNADVEEPFGAYTGLANNLVDKDPCSDNFATQVVFFNGSPYPSSSYPGLFDTPFCTGPGNISAPCQDAAIVSPVLDLSQYSSNCDENQDTPIPDTSNLGGAVLRFTTYRDIPLGNLVFYTWGVRDVDAQGCPGIWKDRNYVYYGPDMDYIFGGFDVSDLVAGPNLQVRVGVADMCDAWYLVYGNCAAHTPSPWIDNVRFYRYETLGPQWSHRDLDIFQDAFPQQEFDIESTCRADNANDWLPNDNPRIVPGDSSVITCSSPIAGGLAIDGAGPAVYCHVLINHLGPDAKTPPSGAVLEDDWGWYHSMDGAWTVMQCDSALTSAGSWSTDKYCIDLNDSLFTRGFEINFYFKAQDLDGNWSTLPLRAEEEGDYFEFTCLPTLNSDILYVDDFHGRGTLAGNVQEYWDQSFEAVLPTADHPYGPDRYDVNNPSSSVSNGPGTHAKNFHMTTAYNKVIWDSGNLENTTISEGTDYSDKSNDCQLLIDWLNLSEHDVSLWVCGDDIAFDLDGSTAAQALDLMSNWCGVTLVNDSYYDLTGGRTAGGLVSPLLHTVTGANWTNPLHVDSFYVDAGCPIINAFDVLGTTAASQYVLQYPDFPPPPEQGDQYYAGVQNELTNAAQFAVKTMWFGFSFQYIRDASVSPGVAMVRNRIVENVILWMGNPSNDNITETDVPAAYKLAQNFPNPFNPSTTIMFDMREKGHVSLRIYNVAGQLVRTLVNDVKEAGAHKVTWDGKNNHGVNVASGVYFYKMETTSFSQTKKMVMLR